MSKFPNRVSQWRNALERGESVDLNRLATLQALDLVIAGREFVDEAISFQQEADDKIKQLLESNLR